MSHPVVNEAYLLRHWDYQNNTELQVYVMFAFTMANCAMLSFTSCVGVAANALVIWAVIRQKSLQTSSNALVVNLAVVDLLRSAVDCPLLLSALLRGRGALGPGVSMLCDAQMLSFSFGCCLQLLTLASIGAERYRAIASPFEARQQRRRRVMVWIPLTWTVASVLTAVCMARARDAPVYVKCRGLRADAVPVYNTFGRYILIPVWCGCFALVTGFYGRIFCIVRVHNRKIFDHGNIFLPSRNKCEAGVDDGKERANAKSSELKQSNQRKRNTAKKRDGKRNPPHLARQTTCDFSPGRSIIRQNSKDTHISKYTRCLTACNSQSPPSGKVELTKDRQKQWDKQTREASSEASARVPVTVEWPGSIDLESSDAASAPVQSTAVEFDVKEVPPNQPAAAGESAQIAGAVCTMPPPANRERGMRNRESNLAKRSGYIVLTFLLFWTPLVVSVLVNLFAHRRKSTTMRIALEVEMLSVSVACLTSAANPITHALVNPQFRTEFQNLRAKCNVKTLCSKP